MSKNTTPLIEKINTKNIKNPNLKRLVERLLSAKGSTAGKGKGHTDYFPHTDHTDYSDYSKPKKKPKKKYSDYSDYDEYVCD